MFRLGQIIIILPSHFTQQLQKIAYGCDYMYDWLQNEIS